MQIKRSTAGSKIVGIPNIDTVENNIHAGAKYLRYLADKYFPEKEISEFNRIMLTLAAYNAGPNRIAALRRKAKNPNVWFGSVETVVAREVNQIPVRYVLNIAQRRNESFRLRIEARDKKYKLKSNKP